MENQGEVIFYNTDDGLTHIEVKVEDETVWLTIDQMSELFGKARSTINEHILNVFSEGELLKSESVRKIGNSDFSTKPTNYYNLDVIISVGYRVKSIRGTQFRRWATERLKEYMIKGFTMDDERLKGNGGGNYWKELLDRIRDTVSYQNLVPGKEYKVSGVLMDKETGEELLVDGKNVTAETVFTPEKSEGTVELTFVFDGSALEGKTMVAFETLTYQEKEVATHTDIEDQEQSIYFPQIHTTAKDGTDGDQEVTESEKMTVVDTVAYENLETGKQYKVAGVLMDKTTGKELLIQDEQVTAETVFEAKEAKGTVDVTFTFDGTGLAGKELVVFEKLYLVSEEGEIEVTAHEDLEDQGQTVKVVEKELPPKPETPKSDTPKTGDRSQAMLWLIVAGISAASAAGISFWRRKGTRKKK